MRLYYLYWLSLSLVLGAPIKTSRVCDPDKTSPHYTGFRVDKQVFIDSEIKRVETHLSLCKEGRLITDLHVGGDDMKELDTGIPWNKTLCAGDVCYKMSRRKTYALRPIALYAPSSFVGGLFEIPEGSSESQDENYTPTAKLVSDTLYHQWIEITKGSPGKVYHIPLLYTPDVDDRLYKIQVDGEEKDGWFRVISANENYDYSVETRNVLRKSIDLTMAQVKNVVRNTTKRLKALNADISDSIPVRKPIKSVNMPKNINLFNKIFAKRIENLSKHRISKDHVDFSTLMVFSKIVPKDQFELLLKNLNAVFDRNLYNEQLFKYKFSKPAESEKDESPTPTRKI